MECGIINERTKNIVEMTRRHYLFLVFPALAFCYNAPAFAAGKDTSFIQPISVKYPLDGSMQGSQLKKVAVDYNDVTYVLTDKGVCRTAGNKIVKDLRYRPLDHKIPVDITIQEGTGYLYYLYRDEFLSNADAGVHYGKLPGGRYNKIAVAGNGDVLLTGSHTATIFAHGRLHDISLPADKIIEIHAYKNIFYALSRRAVYYLKGDKFLLLYKGNNLTAFAFSDKEIFIGTSHGYDAIDRLTGNEILPLQTKIPVQNIDDLTVVNGRVWAGTPDGAFMKRRSEGFNYYASKRWLDQDSVISLAADSKGNIYLLTATGLNEIKFIRQTYLQKARYFQQMTRRRHIRYGLLSEVRMSIPGDPATAMLVDTDNDGLWTSFYLGSQAFRYAVTKSAQAKRYCWESFAAYERLLSITSVKGFPARSFERAGVKVSDPAAWHPSPDSGWIWKGTTSSDEFVGYIFVCALMDEFVVQTAGEKQRVANFIDRILTHILKHHLNFVDVNGKPTLWGRWNPKYINSYAKTISDRKLGSTDIIAGLELGYALTKKEIYKKEAFRLMYREGYLDNIMISPYNIKPTPGYEYKGRDMGMGPWNHSDDEMEFLSYWVLYHYAFNNALKQKFGKAIRAYWKIELPEKNPVWNLITLGTEGSFDKAATLWDLRELPMDMIRWNIKNSTRKDLTFLKPNFRQQFTQKVISPEAAPVHRYNANAFKLDGGDGGRTELSGAIYLLPYWMARYFNVIR